MPFDGLRSFVEFLKKNDQLKIIDKYVSTDLEITEITDRVVKNKGPALLFTNNGTSFPLLINAYGSEKRMLSALYLNSWEEVAFRLNEIKNILNLGNRNFFEKLNIVHKIISFSEFIPEKINKKGKCQEVILKEPDINILPILKCWPLDAGKFITLPIVNTISPITGSRNAGMYRMQVIDKTSTCMHWHLHKGGARHYEEYKKLGKIMPVSVVLGGDPVYAYVASAPLPDDVDEYILASFLRNSKVKLVKCITNDLWVPEDADIVIEGFIDPKEPLVIEGPFGDHTGFYSTADYYPKFHITCITHRKDAIYPATIVGIPPHEDAFLAKATERIFLPLIQNTLAQEISDIHMPIEGVFHNLTLLSVKKRYKGHPHKIMNLLWGAGQLMFNKIFVVFDDDVNLSNYEDLALRLCNYVNSFDDITISKGPADVLDHSSQEFAFGGKIGFDATKKDLNNSNFFNFDLNIDLNNICKKLFPEIIHINDNLLQKKIPIIFIYIYKHKKNQAKNLFYEMLEKNLFDNIRFVVFLSQEAEIDDISLTIWRFLNNYDPARDTYISQKSHLIIGMDGTEKNSQFDLYKREWPPVIKMSTGMIKKIDAIWYDLGFESFIPSPSLKINNKLIIKN